MGHLAFLGIPHFLQPLSTHTHIQRKVREDWRIQPNAVTGKELESIMGSQMTPRYGVVKPHLQHHNPPTMAHIVLYKVTRLHIIPHKYLGDTQGLYRTATGLPAPTHCHISCTCTVTGAWHHSLRPPNPRHTVLHTFKQSHTHYRDTQFQMQSHLPSTSPTMAHNAVTITYPFWEQGPHTVTSTPLHHPEWSPHTVTITHCEDTL